MKNLDLNKIDGEYFKLFFALSPDLFCIANDSGYFQHLNSAWEEVLGFTPEEILKTPFAELVHPEDVERTLIELRKLGEGLIMHAFENRYRCKDGSYRHFSWNAMKHSTRNLIFAVARDITDQKNVEAHLKSEKREAETQTENIHRLLSQVPALAAVTKGPEHVFAFANPEFCTLLGIKNPVGMSAKEVAPHSASQNLELLNQVFRTGEKFTAENVSVTADWTGSGQQSVRSFTFIYSPLKDSTGAVYGIWNLAFDVTEIKMMQDRLEISEKMASLGTIAAGVAHEINNPLAYVSGLLELTRRQVDGLNSDNLADEKAQLFQKMKVFGQGLDRIAKIVKSLKAFSRTDEDSVELVDIAEVLRATLQFAETEVKHRARIDLDLQDLPFCYGNESKLIQVFLNLIVNAAHAIPLGRVHQNSITLKARAAGENSVEISVSDTGCGIAPQNLSKVFDPFYTSKPVGEGTGLGLSICHGIISSMNGTIQVESQVGFGTTFKVTLPATHAAPASNLIQHESAPEVVKPQAPKTQTVLVIDDEVAFGEVIGLCLETDFSVTVVNSVHDALIEIAKHHQFDIILCDLMMPYQTGMDLYYNLARNSPGMQDHMIFMTGGVFTSEANDFLAKIKLQKINKPFSMQELRTLIQTSYQNSPKRAA